VDFGTDFTFRVTADRLRFRVYLIPAEVINDREVFANDRHARKRTRESPVPDSLKTAKTTDLSAG